MSSLVDTVIVIIHIQQIAFKQLKKRLKCDQFEVNPKSVKMGHNIIKGSNKIFLYCEI